LRIKYKILVIDDDNVTTSLIKYILESESEMYQIFIAENGKIGYEESISLIPDLILMDLEMPVQNGMQTLHLLKNNEVTKDIPVIMITSSTNLKKAINSGALDFIHKPIETLELLVRVKSTLSMYKLLHSVMKQAEQLELQSEELERQKKILEEEKKKSDQLLVNILPYEIAEQLKNKGFVDAKHYRRVTVMFTDFKGFTKITEDLSTEQLVKELNIYFEKFDEIIGMHYLEKIKTIGDAYMCVGGLPIRNKSNPIDTVLAALKIRKFVEGYNEYKISNNLPPWDLRIGIHTGEVIAGVIGQKKFAYDIWGDTVNKASRMESSGEVGQINISGETYQYIRDYFSCDYRGKIAAKNKGEIDMYFVKCIKPELTNDPAGILPNQHFLQLLSEY